jgi:hypothetical protein
VAGAAARERAVGMNTARMIAAGILTGGNLRYPYSVDFSTLADGALPSRLTGATWAVSGGKAINTPGVSAEKLTNGDLENWASATDAANWAEGKGGTSTINREDVIVHSGSHAARYDIDALNSSAFLQQTGVVTPAGTLMEFSFWGKSDPVGLNPAVQYNTSVNPNINLTGDYAQYFTVERAYAANQAINFSRAGTAANGKFYWDDLSLKFVTAGSEYALTHGNTPNMGVRGSFAIGLGSQAGVVVRADGDTNPQNCVVLRHNGGSRLRLEYCVNGEWTVDQDYTIAYVANADIELRPNGTSIGVWYNGSLRGTRTIDNAALNNNTYYGIFGSARVECNSVSFTPI